MPKIRVKLNEVSKAIDEVKRFRAEVEIKVRELVLRLAQAGVEIASAKLSEMGAIDTGDLDSDIHYMISDDGKRGFVRVDNDHAAYVEFGTGVMGAGKSHPTLPWAYDVNGHGDTGWWYPCTASSANPTKRQAKDGSWWAWTKGMPSRPFMYETAQELSEKCGEIAKEVFQK